MVPSHRRQRLAESDKVTGNQPCALMNQLVKRMLTVRTRFSPEDRPRLVSNLASIESDVFAERFLIQIVSTPPHKGKFTREIMQGELDRFYYDTAQISNAVTLDALAKLVPISQIVYGTDFPYRSAAEHTKGVTEFFKGDDLKAVDRENALRLIPRLKTV